MSRRVHKHAPFLHVLATGSKKQRQGVIDGAGKDLITCVCECALNVLNGNVSLTAAERTKLRRHRRELRELTNRRTSLQKKKKALTQKGGFLGALLTPVLSALGGLLFK